MTPDAPDLLSTTAPARRDWLPSLGRGSLALVLLLIAPALVLLANLRWPRLRERLTADARGLLGGLTRDTRWPLALIVLVTLGLLIVRHPFPPDDLARDLVAHFTGYDYRRMFWGSPLIPPYNQYLGFDHLAALAQGLPASWRALPFQALALIGLLAVMVRALYTTPPRSLASRHLAVAALVLLTLSMPGVATRILQGRPEVWFSVWALSALVLPARVWLVVGLCLAPTYWLAPVYGGAAFLLRERGPHPWRCRILYGVTYGVLSAGLWLVLSHGQWLDGFTDLARAGENRIASVNENGTIWMLLDGTALLALAVSIWHYRAGFRVRADLDLWLALAVFLVPNMVRYTDVVSPLLVLLLARAVARSPALPVVLPAPALRLGVVWVALALLPAAFNGLPAPAPGFLAHVQPGDRILSPFSPTLYRAIYAAVPHGGVLAPAMEVGFTTKAVQRMALDLEQGTVSCAALHAHHVRWLVENTLSGTPPPCLTLDSTDGTLRAWRVD